MEEKDVAPSQERGLKSDHIRHWTPTHLVAPSQERGLKLSPPGGRCWGSRRSFAGVCIEM